MLYKPQLETLTGKRSVEEAKGPEAPRRGTKAALPCPPLLHLRPPRPGPSRAGPDRSAVTATAGRRTSGPVSGGDKAGSGSPRIARSLPPSLRLGPTHFLYPLQSHGSAGRAAGARREGRAGRDGPFVSALRADAAAAPWRLGVRTPPHRATAVTTVYFLYTSIW